MAEDETTENKNRGRPSMYAGKTVKPLVAENPRRPGTHGHKSFEILLANPDGMTYEEYISEGGRRNDLLFDVERERASVTD